MFTWPSIVAIHGLEARPEYAWSENVGTMDRPQWINWLNNEDMLPVVAPNARIMQYGYRPSVWDTGMWHLSKMADEFLRTLQLKRKVKIQCI